MNNRDLEKRYKGLHYEVGQLPDPLINSTFYWNLPYEIRQFVHQILSPNNLIKIHQLRSRQTENPNVSTLKPFYNTQSIFVHIPKSAGISVGFSLYGRKTGDHRTIADYNLCFRKSDFESFFKFTFVRNPWDRLLSAYLYLKKGGRNQQDYDWSVKFLSSYNSFEDFVTDWVNEENIRLGLHFRPQYEFLCVNDFIPKVDFIGYFENIVNDYEYIRYKIGLGTALTVANQTTDTKKDYRYYYTEKTKKIVESVYRKDIEIFGYNFDNTSLESQLENRWRTHH